ncbi:ABC transporter substrate-binding protein [Ammoniphilus oxalaticus]|uniref:ABC transporter substrate-binding protein n=1 Tax=Ammoniphilus oxalaticus TaxID=66863 RepID=A0A419SEL2_9BACL|nr:ABC transporter substrate-binding protein [Ammoniphilus oxalaticus]RKD21758.1 ABC transporter substrate-binding protein [Ammoniphilus oxalaticus]
MFKKLGMVLLASSMLALGACGSNPSNGGATEGKGNGGATELKKVSIMLDWYPNAVHSILYAGIDQGYFEEKGLELDIKIPADTTDPLKMVATGDVDFAMNYQPQVVMARAENIPVVGVAPIVRHPLNWLMAPEDSDVESPKDLEGKTIGYPAIPMNEALVKTIIETDGGDSSKVNLVDVNWDLMPAITSGNADAISGGYINHEQVLLKKNGHPVRAFNPVEYGVPDYHELMLVTSEKLAEEQADLVKDFVEVMTKGFEYVQANADEALDKLLERQDASFPLEKDVEEESLSVLLPLMTSNGEAKFGSQSVESWAAVIDWMKEQELIEVDVDADACFIKL